MLTVEELKGLKVGDWVWIVETCDNGTYWQVTAIGNNVISVGCHKDFTMFLFPRYGKTWLAYKNKEEAEQEPVLKKFVDDFCDYLLKSEDDCLDDECGIVEKAVYEDVIITFGRMVEKRFGIKVFDDEEK